MKQEDEKRLTRWFDQDPERELSSKRWMDADGKLHWVSFVWRPDLNRYVGAMGETRDESETRAIQRAIKATRNT